VGNAFSYGWAKFQQYLGPILLAMLVLFIAAVVVGFVWLLITGAIANAIWEPSTITFNETTGQFEGVAGSSAGLFGALLIGALNLLVWSFLVFVIQAGVVRAALAITRGERIEPKTFFTTDKLGPVLIASALVAIMTAIGYLLCYIPGIVVGFFSAYFLYFLIDHNLSPVESIKASFSFVAAHLGQLILFFLASALAYIIGAILCGIGLIVAIPVIIIAQAYTFKKLTNGTVAA
jgi:uncharacterized membrane protein